MHSFKTIAIGLVLAGSGLIFSGLSVGTAGEEASSDGSPTSTTIGEAGGSAVSHDGLMRLDIPAGAISQQSFPDWWQDSNEVDIEITNFSEQLGEHATHADDPRYTDFYMIGHGPVSALDKPATLSIEVGDVPAGHAAYVVNQTAGVHGLHGDSVVEGSRVRSDTDFADAMGGPFGAVVFEITDQCKAIDPVGRACEIDTDCDVAGNQEPITCQCAEGQVDIDPECQQGQCVSAATGCGGIGMDAPGHCSGIRDRGGWAGDCF